MNECHPEMRELMERVDKLVQERERSLKEELSNATHDLSLQKAALATRQKEVREKLHKIDKYIPYSFLLAPPYLAYHFFYTRQLSLPAAITRVTDMHFII